MTRNNYIICHCTTKWGLHHKVTNFGFPYFFQTLHLETMYKRTKIIYHNALQELSRKNSNEDGELWEPLPPWVETKCFTTSKLFENFDLSKLKILTDEASVSEIIIDNVVPTLSGDVEQPQCNQSDLLPRISPKPISEIICENTLSPGASSGDDSIQDPEYYKPDSDYSTSEDEEDRENEGGKHNQKIFNLKTNG